MSEIVLFDYGQLDVETRIVVQQRTSEIKDLLRSALGDMIEAGRKCKEVRDALRHNKSGGFMGWVDREGLGRQTVYNIISMHDAFGNYPKFGQLDIAKTAAYLLAAPSTPEPARLEAIERAEAGETITVPTAKAIVAQHKTAPPAIEATPADHALDRKISQLSSWLIARGWGIMFAPMPAPCDVHKGATKFVFSNRDDKQGLLEALRTAMAHEETPAPASTPPVDRPQPAPARPLTDEEAEAVVWRAIGIRAKSGMNHHRLAWLQSAAVGDFSQLLNPGVSFDADQLDRIRAKVEAELGKQGTQVSDTPKPAALALGPEPTPEPAAEPEPEKDENYTPPYIIKAVRQVLGKIDLDPASSAVAQRVVLATVYLTKANDSLQPRTPWLGRVWLNPPFSGPAPFTNKLIEEYEAGRTKAAVLLVNNGTETQWGQALLSRPYPVCFVGAHEGGRTRIDFWQKEPDEPRTGNRYAQMFFYLGKEPDKFREVFSQFGVIR